MNAWLISWEWLGNHARVDDPLIAILSARKSAKKIATFVETIYLMASCTAKGMAYYMNRPNKNPYKATEKEIINDIPHGERIRCGHNPWIYARKVSKLTISINEKRGTEIVSWKEPPVFKWKNEQRINTVLCKEGKHKKQERELGTLLKWTEKY